MSATLPNMDHLATWLDASLFVTDFRPVQLTTRVCCGRRLLAVGEEVRLEEVQSVVVPAVKGTDPEGLLGLVLETVCTGKSVLVFCPSKRRCETVAAMVAQGIRELVGACGSTERPPRGDYPVAPSTLVLPAPHYAKLEKCQRVLNDLRHTPVGLCPMLRDTVSMGVAHHHAGLVVDERNVCLPSPPPRPFSLVGGPHIAADY